MCANNKHAKTLLIISLLCFSVSPCNPAMAVTECCGYSDSGNTYPCQGGNCTWWAAYKRPETNFPGSGRDAKYWLDLAKQNGLPTGSKPEEGSIAVFEHISSYGHVAYVEDVSGDTFRVSEMFWNGGCTVGKSTYNVSDASGFIFPADDENGGSDDLPDLRVHELRVNKIGQQSSQSIILQPGEQFQITVEIKNKGDGNAGDKFYVKYLISDDMAFDSHDEGIPDETGDDDDSIPSLDSGDTDDEEIIVNAPDTPGTYYVGAWADYKDDIDEEDESNNFSDSDDEIAKIIVVQPEPEIPVGAILAIINNLILDESEPVSEMLGNLNGDSDTNISDAILALKVLCGYIESEDLNINGDVNGDKKIGLAELVYILRKVSELQ